MVLAGFAHCGSYCRPRLKQQEARVRALSTATLLVGSHALPGSWHPRLPAVEAYGVPLAPKMCGIFQWEAEI